MNIKHSILILLLALLAGPTHATNPKHEFRGAWLHIIGQGQYARMTSEETQKYLVNQLDLLQKSGCNAVLWQVRPQADAAYVSELEPWSRWITGEAGKAPNPLWDPLQFMIEESHKRGMELHAWINPYRVTSGKDDKPAAGHVYYEHPEWFLDYADGKIYFDPGLPESRNFIDKVVRDILARYDVDAIHMDDYFYPYPVQDAEFPDTASYNRYGLGWDLGDWRRHNVDLLIEQLHNTIAEVKPWVRFGISPFGIWRNKKNDPDGSETNGLQCYDRLYADCPKWTAEGWVDYMVPQLYWELEHKAAGTLELAYWWDRHANGRHMYYGQAIYNVMSHRDIAADGGDTLNPTQLAHKFRLMRELPHVQGPCWWPGYNITDNHKGILDSLTANYQSTPALIPAYSWLDDKAPAAVENLKVSKLKGGDKQLTWNAASTTDPMQEAVRFVVYRFKKGQNIDLNNAAAIQTITGGTTFDIPKQKGKWIWVVTALDRCWNESAPVSIK
ncbi:MAG: family 10 glycosylhydrolase [Muribaculaceae bacterium]|nr:family 10 glycosylhydrolase [Muribaculaceae bacterium]